MREPLVPRPMRPGAPEKIGHPCLALGALDRLENSGSHFLGSSIVRSHLGSIEAGVGCFQGAALTGPHKSMLFDFAVPNFVPTL